MEPDKQTMVEAALEALTGERHTRTAAVELVPPRPGLYAFYGDHQAWAALALEPAHRDQPLQVGKAERSLTGRDVGTHLTTGKTGSSTVRRSLAALLAEQLDEGFHHDRGVPAPHRRPRAHRRGCSSGSSRRPSRWAVTLPGHEEVNRAARALFRVLP